MRKHIQDRGSNVEVCTVSITEDFSLREVAAKLHRAALMAIVSNKPLLAAFQINIGKFKRSEKAEWRALMNRISQLFISLLVLHQVEDPLSDEVFNVPPGRRLEVLVEIADRRGHLDEDEIGDLRLTDELPVLAAVGEIVDALAQPFDVGAKAMHVSKYLKAFEDCTIDELYGSGGGGPKDVMIVLDDSGSMHSGRIETCQTSVQSEILGSRLGAQDRIGVGVLCKTQQNVALGRWSLSHHASQIQSAVQNARATGGSTPLWQAMLRAIRELLVDGTNSKWLVALTDGGATDPEYANQVNQLLRSTEAQRITVLFITMDLHYSLAADIRNTCIRAGTNDAMISANGGLQAILEACCLAQIPLMIVGPPGSSKTLAVTVVAENARGENSTTEFYKEVSTILPFRYQCSRRSTSNEIEAVFK